MRRFLAGPLCASAIIGLAACDTPPATHTNSAPCKAVDPLVVRVADGEYRLTQNDIAAFATHQVAWRSQRVGDRQVRAYCTRSPTPSVPSIIFDMQGIRQLPADYHALQRTRQVSLRARGELGPPIPGVARLDEKTGLMRSGGDKVYTLASSNLPGWGGPILAHCMDTITETLTIRYCRVDALGPAGARLEVKLNPDEVPAADWPEVLGQARELFASLSTSPQRENN